MKKDLVLGFADTYDNAKKFFVDVLSRRYNVVQNDTAPKYLIFGDSNFGQSHYKIQGAKKVFFTGENVRPNYFTYNHAITFDHENSPKHYRLPLYILELWAIVNDDKFTDDYGYLCNKKIDVEKEWDKKRKFSSYVQSNPNCEYRTNFIKYLLERNKVTCAGPHLNNTGFIIPRDRKLKIDFFSQALFGIAFENGAYPGYVTEKLVDCYFANTVPVYWGSKTVHKDFNEKSFINANDMSYEKTYEYMEYLANHKNEYLDILTQPAFPDNIPNYCIDQFLSWFDTFVYEG